MLVEKPKYPESVLGVARFEKDYAVVEKKQDRYQSSKRQTDEQNALGYRRRHSFGVSQHEEEEKRGRTN
jgi:hypothetical protein